VEYTPPDMAMPEKLAIRDLRPGDVGPLVAIAQEAFSSEQTAFGFDPRRLAREGRFMAWIYPLQRRLPRPMSVVLIGLVGDRPVGAVIAEPRRESWYINTVMVGKDHRRHGYARAMVEAICARAAKAGGRRALLHVREDNEPAYGLYRALGFAPFERVHRMLLVEPAGGEAAPLPEGYTLEPSRRYDPRALAINDACREPESAAVQGPSRFPGLLERAVGKLFRPKDRARMAVVRGGDWVGLWTYVQVSQVEAAQIGVKLLPEHRGKGLEQPLLERALARAAAAGVERVTIGVGVSETALLEACETLGFVTRFVFVGMARPL